MKSKLRKKTPTREVAIQLTGVTKTYELHHEKPTFSEKVLKRRRTEQYTALKNIDLTIYKGEKVGIIGKNGAGKTTLLKIIAGITTPTKGTVKTYGRVVSLIDLEAGFHPDLTGEENIFLNGLVIGMSKQEIREKFKAIVAFADIGKFIDAPMYTYSNGMKLRLGFSVAVHAEPDILILDEGLSVGDSSFQDRCESYFKQFHKEKKTLLVSLHLMDFIKNNCKRIITLNKGEVTIDGGLSKIKIYEKEK